MCDASSEKSTARYGGSLPPRRGYPQPTQIVLFPTPTYPVRISPTGQQAARLGSSSSAPELAFSLQPQHCDDADEERAWTADCTTTLGQRSPKRRSLNSGLTTPPRKPNRFVDASTGAVYSSPQTSGQRLSLGDNGRPNLGLDQINVDEAFALMLARSKNEALDSPPSPKARLNFSRSSVTSSKREEGWTSPDGSTEKTDTFTSSPSTCGGPLSPREDRNMKTPEQCRQAFRYELMNVTGGALEAFRSIDLNGSGQISFQEFTTGLARLAVNWQEATGLDSLRKVFRLFDQKKEGALKLVDLFPDALRQTEVETYRLSTPEFLEHWCMTRQNADQKRRPKWQMEEDEQLRALFVSAESRQNLDGHKHWMSSTIRRMKKLGKSDAYCREKCALHLPKGSGPFDRERKHAFGENDVRLLRREYTDKVIGTVRNVQKTVYELREQRLELQASRRTMIRLGRKRDVYRDSHIGQRRSIQREEEDEEEEEI